MLEKLVTLYIRVNGQIYRFKLGERWLWVQRQPDGRIVSFERLTPEAAREQARKKIGKKDADWNRRFAAWAVYDIETCVWDDLMIYHIVDAYENRKPIQS